MQLRSSLVSMVVAAALAACSSTQTPPPATPAPEPVVAQPAPAPTPEPAPAPAAPSDAHLNRGHITLDHQIQFDTASDHIREDASSGPLSSLVALLQQNTQVRRVRVEGHTDERGGHGDNQSLSQRRAEAVAVYLRAHGFQNIQFESVGYGETQPLCRDNTDECHERNRRVEFTITDPAAPAQ